MSLTVADDNHDAAPSEAPFTSYSLNFEDVLLHRAFRDRADGFYVDVGAGHPRFENDTRALYDRGWHGISVEPNAAFAALHAEERPRDVCVGAALSDGADELAFFEIPGTGLSTCDAALAAQHRADGLTVIERRVKATTLARVLDEHGATRIDLLKVDAEGLEEAILDGNDWSRFRPDLVLVEATLPQRPERRETGIAAAMQARGYRHVHFDGLNDYYAERDFALPEDFTLPPNVFDGFVPAQVGNLETVVQSATEASESARSYALSLESTLDAERAERARAVDAHRQEAEAWRGQLEDLQAAFTTSRDYAQALEAERAQLREQSAALTAQNQALLRERNGLAARLDVTGSDRDRIAASRDAVQSRLATVEVLAIRLLDLRLDRRRGYDDEKEKGMSQERGAVAVADGAKEGAGEGGALDPFVRACLDRAESRANAARLDCDDLRAENRRLRNAVTQLRAENAALNHALLPLHNQLADTPPPEPAPEVPDVLPEQLAQAREELYHLTWAKADLMAQLAEAKAQVEALQERLAATYGSSSWKLTRPLRGLSRTVRGQQGPDWP